MSYTRRTRAPLQQQPAGDENAPPAVARLTRSKAGKPDIKRAAPQEAMNRPLPSRKRAALGDVSNVNKEKQEHGKAGRVTKPTANITKTRLTSTTTVLEEKPAVLGEHKANAPQVRRERAVNARATDKENVGPNSAATIATAVDEIPATKRAKTTQPPVQAWDDLDAEDTDDPLMVAEYVVEIFEYMRELEISTLPNPDYMDQQAELKWDMRGVLVDWLIEVHTKFRLYAETLFIAVNIIDRFLSQRVVSLPKFQLVGITALILAAKYEEVQVPSIQNFIYMTDGGYTDDEILKAERYVLQVLEYNLAYPTPMNFLRRISKADNYDIQTRTVAKYLMEISLLDHRFISYPPSHIAAAAMYAARSMLGRSKWDANLIHYSGGYKEDEILPVYELMVDYLAGEIRHDAFFKKYASKRFLKASLHARTWAQRLHAKKVKADIETEMTDLEENN